MTTSPDPTAPHAPRSADPAEPAEPLGSADPADPGRLATRTPVRHWDRAGGDRQWDLQPGPLESVVEDQLQEAVWQRRAAGWVQPRWRLVPGVRPEVSALLTQQPGPALLRSVFDIVLHPGGGCPVEHPPSRWGPVGDPGAPCACQVITAAAWQAAASWTQHAADQHLITTPQRRRVGHREITDPAVEELAVGLSATPGSMNTRLRKVRRRGRHPHLLAAVAAGRLPGWQADQILDDLTGYPPARIHRCSA